MYWIPIGQDSTTCHCNAFHSLAALVGGSLAPRSAELRESQGIPSWGEPGNDEDHQILEVHMSPGIVSHRELLPRKMNSGHSCIGADVICAQEFCRSESPGDAFMTRTHRDQAQLPWSVWEESAQVEGMQGRVLQVLLCCLASADQTEVQPCDCSECEKVSRGQTLVNMRLYTLDTV